ncbi:MAG: DsrE family protein [Guyparkeria sp.]
MTDTILPARHIAMPSFLLRFVLIGSFLAWSLLGASLAWAQAKVVTPDYEPPKVVYDFYLADPQEIGPALFWVRSLINPLQASPYNMDPMLDMNIVVIIHGTEIVTVAKKNEAKYEDAVARMRYYASLGVDFHVCGLAAQDYDYDREDFQDFITLVPSAFTDLVHYQQQGYAVIKPEVLERTQSLESMR